ncbi:MAG: YbhN family protein [Candidatus Hermodarchaeota archaeon]
MKNSWKSLIILVISVMVIVTLILIINSKDPQQLSYGLHTLLTNPVYPILFLLIFIIVFFLRGLRWNILLLKNIDYKLYFTKLLLIAWFLNAITPARLGDLSRIYYPRRDKIATGGQAFSVVLVDRVIDLFTLISFALIWIALLGFRLFSSGFYWLLPLVLALIITFAIGCIILIKYPQVLSKIIIRIFKGQSKLSGRLNKFLENFENGIKFIYKNPVRIFYALALSLFIWVLESTSVYLIALALNFELDPIICFASATAGFLGAALPFLPGGVGSYEVGIASSLVILGFGSLQEAVLIAFMDHLIRQLFVIFTGGFLFIFNDRELRYLKTGKLKS